MEKICNRCVMDTTAKDIVFDENGICNFCKDFEKKFSQINQTNFDINELVNKIKKDGKNKKYDCIVGVSGGVDSSYVLLKVKELGLRPLAVHLDNGWNSDLATKNISNLVEKLDVDLYTHVIDWEENKDLQKSFFKANVVDIELLMDNAMQATNYAQAKKYGVKYILSGSNTATEGIRMPEGWCGYKHDAKNIKKIQKKFGTKKIKTHPLISTIDWIKYTYINNIRWIPFLNYLEYDKEKALQKLESEIGYIRYPYKHYESVFTRFYQGYILPNKFNIDKRKVHLSSLIMSNQMSRDEALQLLKTSPYPDEQLLKSDKEFVMKKLDFTDSSFEEYIKTPGIAHSVYGSEENLQNLWISFVKLCKKILHKDKFKAN